MTLAIIRDIENYNYIWNRNIQDYMKRQHNSPLEDDYWNEYTNLGGTKTKEQYLEILDIFFEETLDIFVYGDATKHNDRTKAAEAVLDNADISVKEYNLIFDSVDNITAYT